MKIAHLVCTYPPYKGGMGNSAKQLAELSARKHEVTVFTPKYDKAVFEAGSSVRVVRLRTPFKYGNAAWLPQLVWRLRKFDLVYLHYPFYGVHKSAYNVPMLWRKPLITHYHMDTVEQGWKAIPFWLSRKLVMPIVLHMSKRIVVSSFDYIQYSNLASYFEKHREKFVELPFWVDSNKFKPTENKKSSNVINLLFVGALDEAHYFKGLPVLLEALKKVKAEVKRKFILNIVGDGNLRSQYEALAQHFGLSEDVKFKGKLDDNALVKINQQSDLLILPSINKSEAFGLVLLEAMSSGLPVIASNLPGVRSVFIENIHGLRVEPSSVDDLADKIGILMINDEQREVMGQRARAYVLEKYQAVSAEKILAKLYEDCSNK